MCALVLRFTDGWLDVVLLMVLLMVEGFARIMSKNYTSSALRRRGHAD
jgi:hypothetical protein